MQTAFQHIFIQSQATVIRLSVSIDSVVIRESTLWLFRGLSYCKTTAEGRWPIRVRRLRNGIDRVGVRAGPNSIKKSKARKPLRRKGGAWTWHRLVERTE